MKRSLNEQIERIQSLGLSIKNPKLLAEQKLKNILDSIINYLSNFKKYGIKISRSYNEGMKKLQQGLIALGYDLPRYGADGYYGNETKAALTKFINDNKGGMLSESAAELRSTLSSLGYDEKGNEITSGGEITDNTSSIGSAILKAFKQLKPDVDVIITSGNDAYHHRLNYPSKHKFGKALDFVIRPYNEENANAFLSVLNDMKSKYPITSYSDEYRNPSRSATGGHFHIQINTPSKSMPSQTTQPRNVLPVISPTLILTMIDMLKEKSANLENDMGNQNENSGIITQLDLTNPEDVQKYAEIANNFISRRNGNPLGITGEMIANGAKQAFDKYGQYVPPEISLSQLAIEGGVGNPDPNIRPVRTKNPYNVGNVDTGKNKYFNNVQDAINLYFNVIAKNYVSGKSPEELLTNFTNNQGNRYASAPGYEDLLGRVAKGVRKIGEKFA